MYGINYSGKLFTYELIEWLLEAFLSNHNVRCLSIKSMHSMDKKGVFSYVDDCIYWYTPEALGTWFMDTLGNIFHVKCLVYAHWFMSIIFLI